MIAIAHLYSWVTAITNRTFTAIFGLCGLIIIIMPVITMAANSLVTEVMTQLMV